MHGNQVGVVGSLHPFQSTTNVHMRDEPDGIVQILIQTLCVDQIVHLFWGE